MHIVIRAWATIQRGRLLQPARVRGLKDRWREDLYQDHGLQPARVRGLKEPISRAIANWDAVATRACTRLEGTCIRASAATGLALQPARVRGLKVFQLLDELSVGVVATRACTRLEGTSKK